MFYRELATDVWEFPPRNRTIEFHLRNYHLAFPTMIFYNCPFGVKTRLEASHIQTARQRIPLAAFAAGPVQSYDDEVYFPPLGNLYVNGWICSGLVNAELEEQVKRFWSSSFSSDGNGWPLVARALLRNAGSCIDGLVSNRYLLRWSALTVDELIADLRKLPDSLPVLSSEGKYIEFYPRCSLRYFLSGKDAENCYSANGYYAPNVPGLNFEAQYQQH